MTTNTFYVLASIRTGDGFENFGKFNLGNSRRAAAAVFRQLRGSPDIDRKTMLTMELMETVNQLPVNLHIIGCTLEELAFNCKVIAKETFKFHNLEQA